MQDPNQNHLLAALARRRVRPPLPSSPTGSPAARRRALRIRRQLDYVYFPTTAIISIHYLLENGGSSEIAGVGNEGVLGVALFMGGGTPRAAP
jgi:hypothetical protein